MIPIAPKMHKPRIKARQILVSHEIEVLRRDVICLDLEVAFMKRFIKKINSGECKGIDCKESIGISPEVQLAALESKYRFYLEKLNYYKELKSASIADRVEKAVRLSSPSTIEVIL